MKRFQQVEIPRLCSGTQHREISARASGGTLGLLVARGRIWSKSGNGGVLAGEIRVPTPKL